MDTVEIAREILAELRETTCCTYRLRVDKLIDLEKNEPRILEEIGSSVLEVFQLGAVHAAQAVAANGKHWMVDLSLKNRYQNECSKLLAGKKPTGTNVVVLSVERDSRRAVA